MPCALGAAAGSSRAGQTARSRSRASRAPATRASRRRRRRSPGSRAAMRRTRSAVLRGWPQGLRARRRWSVCRCAPMKRRTSSSTPTAPACATPMAPAAGPPSSARSRPAWSQSSTRAAPRRRTTAWSSPLPSRRSASRSIRQKSRSTPTASTSRTASRSG